MGIQEPILQTIGYTCTDFVSGLELVWERPDSPKGSGGQGRMKSIGRARSTRVTFLEPFLSPLEMENLIIGAA